MHPFVRDINQQTNFMFHAYYVCNLCYMTVSFFPGMLFIFQMSFRQKLKLTIASDLNNVLSAIKVQISNESLTALLEKKKIFIPKPGTIEDKGVTEKVWIFMYKLLNVPKPLNLLL